MALGVLLAIPFLGVSAGLSGCSAILGLDEFEDVEAGAASSCTPGEVVACYSGPSTTRGLGTCVPGTTTCSEEGRADGPCVGEILPASTDDCETLDDEDCDGVPNDGCKCSPSTIEECYSGPSGTEGVSICHGGQRVCSAEGVWGDCQGEQVPLPETCETAVDDDCDGMVNEAGAGCVCAPDSSAPCYTGSDGTEGIGVCHAGMATCNGQGTEYGPCMDEATPGVEDCSQPEDEDCSGYACSQHLWSAIFGGEGPQSTSAVASDSQGNVYVLGNFDGSIKFGDVALISAGTTDVFLAKLDPDGHHLWSKQFGDPAIQGAAAMAVDAADNVVLAGSFSGAIDFGGGALASAGGDDVFAAKLDPGGQLVWAKRYGDASSQTAADVAVDGAGNVVLTGGFLGALDFGNGSLVSAGNSDIYLAKLASSDGAGIWSKRFGDGSVQYSKRLDVDASGNIVVSGRFNGTFGFGANSLTPLDGGIDIFLARFDSQGTVAWSKAFGGSANGNYQVNGLAIDSAGNTLLAGDFLSNVDFGGDSLASAGSADVFIAKFNVAGAHLWSRRFGTASYDIGGEVVIDAADQVMMVGRTAGAIDFGGGLLEAASSGLTDTFLVKLTSSGEHVWSKIFGNADDEMVNHVGVDPAGMAILACGPHGSVDYGGGPLVGSGDYDVVVAKFAP